MPTEVARAVIRKKITVRATARSTKASIMKGLVPAMLELKGEPRTFKGPRVVIYSIRNERPKGSKDDR